MKSYSQSKLGNLLFAFELDRRLRAAGSRIVSVAAHPGVANTNLFVKGDRSAFQRTMRGVVNEIVGVVLNTDAEGALPTLYAATSAEAEGGGYFGPQGFREMRGHTVGPAKVFPQASDEAAAARLWSVCEELTGTKLL
jgi:NAD(P)-dependent dehydrogenase (short-subunit alcohol dehydrogenase family)